MKNANPMACTPLSPMPSTRDQMGQHWIHNGATVESSEVLDEHRTRVIYHCPNCGARWAATQTASAEKTFAVKKKRQNQG